MPTLQEMIHSLEEGGSVLAVLGLDTGEGFAQAQDGAA